MLLSLALLPIKFIKPVSQMNKYIVWGAGLLAAYFLYRNFRPAKKVISPLILPNPSLIVSEELARDVMGEEIAVGQEGSPVVNLQTGLNADPTFDIDSQLFVGSARKKSYRNGLIPKSAFRDYRADINDTVSRSRVRLKIVEK